MIEPAWATLNELQHGKEHRRPEQKLSEHGDRLGKNSSNDEFRLGLSGFHTILRRLFAAKEEANIAKVPQNVDGIGRHSNAWVDIASRPSLICDSKRVWDLIELTLQTQSLIKET